MGLLKLLSNGLFIVKHAIKFKMTSSTQINNTRDYTFCSGFWSELVHVLNLNKMLPVNKYAVIVLYLLMLMEGTGSSVHINQAEA